MFRHYFRIAIRNLSKQRGLTFINVAGLSLALACFILILLYAVSELNFDKFNTRSSRIFRVTTRFTRDDGQDMGNAGLNVALAPALKKAFPDVEDAVRISEENKAYMKGNNGVTQVKMQYADPGFFEVFSFPLLMGNPRQALVDPYSVVITRSKAKQLFGTEDAVGKTLPIKTDSAFHPFKVSAVAGDMPLNSSVSFDVLGSYQYLEITDSDRVRSSANWNLTYGDQTYVLLRPGSRLPQQSEVLARFRRQHYPEEGKAFRKAKKVTARYVLQPLLAVHADTTVAGPANTIDAKNVWILLGIATGILLIASINFTTLAIARSAGRAREVGVRKVFGGVRRQLIGQFLTESVLLSAFSAVIGCGLTVVLLPWFGRLAGQPLDFPLTLFPHGAPLSLLQLAGIVVALVGIVGLLAGFYPALVLSAFNTIEVLKAKIRLGGSNWFTRGLVTFQFVLSIGLIIATVVMIRQVTYMRSKDLGLIKDNTVMIRTDDIDVGVAYPVFRQELAGNRDVMGITASAMGLGEGQGFMNRAYDFNGKRQGVFEYPVDEHFLPVMGMRLLAGRNFDRAITSDTVENVIVNETLARENLGLAPRQALGQQLTTVVRPGQIPQHKSIIGVVRDFNFERLNKKIRPQLFLMPANFTPSVLYIHLRGGDPGPALAKMAAVWRRMSPEIPFNYRFLDEQLDRFYKSEARWGNIIACAGGISIFLASIGLFGLAALSAANRLKEIGIRRVLGASTTTLIGSLTGGFLRLVALASVIATPIAWVIMKRWLQDFAYRIDISAWIFAFTAMSAILIAFLTIGIQAWRAARTNPVENLRVE
jgi:putative ABC transport system permease protein